MCMQKTAEKLRSWIRTWKMSPEERWLAQSVDIIEVEQKLRQLWTPRQYYSHHIGEY